MRNETEQRRIVSTTFAFPLPHRKVDPNSVVRLADVGHGKGLLSYHVEHHSMRSRMELFLFAEAESKRRFLITLGIRNSKQTNRSKKKRTSR
jgi:hypothetical protein